VRILVYGAGNIGCLYAARLAATGRQVSILARGGRLRWLRERGIVLEDSRSGRRTTTAIQAVEHLEPADPYELVLVVLPRHRVRQVLPALAASRETPSVMFFGNNAAGPAELVEALGGERVLLGFPGAAGFAEDDAIRYLICSAREQPTTIGELDGRRSERIEAIVAALRDAGFPVAVCPRMDAWLKTHAAEMSPTVNALYMCGGDRLRLARTRDGLVLMLRAIREGYRVLGRLGVPITPANHRLFEWPPEPLLVAMMRRMVASDEMSVKVGHTAGSRDEWRTIADELGALTARAGLPTPAMDRLYRYLDPAAEPLADGSAQIALRWGSGRRAQPAFGG
jgi:2-dehydropantoate 2-reductase